MFFIFFMFLLNMCSLVISILNVWNTVKITVLLSLFHNSFTSFLGEFRLIDFVPPSLRVGSVYLLL